jgi:hypothetical protein
MVKTIKQALNPAFLKQKSNREEIELFKKEFKNMLDRINQNESEEFHKRLITDFLNAVYYKDKHYINTKGRNDLVIHNDNNPSSFVGVLIEAKSPKSKEMVKHENFNVKSFQELVYYYLKERITENNLELRYLIITNITEWYVFDARDFENTFRKDKKLIKKFTEFENKSSTATSTDTFYKEIAAPAIDKYLCELDYSYFNIDDYKSIINNKDKKNEGKLVALYKFLSPVHLLKLPFASDSNQLNKEFYAELLHIIGLEEVTQDSKKMIVRKKEETRDDGSIIENAIERIDNKNGWDDLDIETNDVSSQQFYVALDLAITWINRILFLKLLESQIVKYNNGNKDYAFLSQEKLTSYNELDTLFFSVLAQKEEDRKEKIRAKFNHVPYLNSSLFERTESEEKYISIESLDSDTQIPVFSKSVLKKGVNPPANMKPLEYLLRFLDAYDFSNEGSDEIMEENKPLISASVLGLIFEKINGYKDGSFFTPSFITMYMCRETIRRAVVQKFNEVKKWNCETIDDLYNEIGTKTEEIKDTNEIFNTIRICDPAVGSGHFLVSALNEMINLKSELGILADKEHKRLKNCQVTLSNDELIITDNEGNYFSYNPKDKVSQRVQETFFHEKQKIIENCLFGVDINPNSVKICQLRLWIELLKNAYYHFGTDELQTLPNIDINIKCGNSLVSRFDLKDINKYKIGIQSKLEVYANRYKAQVINYKCMEVKGAKKRVRDEIARIKADINEEYNTDDPDYKKLNELKAKANTHFLMREYDGDKNKWKLEMERLNSEIALLKNKLKTIYYNSLEWRIEFPEVLDADGNFVGFDVVIGNPPYMIVYDMFLKKEYERRYPEFVRNNDLYVAFIHKGITILKKNGLFSLITPNTYLKGDYFKNLRKFMQQFQINEIVDFGKKQVFPEANVFTAIFALQKENPLEKWALKSDFSNIRGFINSNDEDFVIKNNLIQKLDKFSKLGEFAEVKDCGYNYWSIGKGKVRQDSIGSRILYANEKKENLLDIAYIKGVNIQKYSLSEPKQFLRHDYSDFLNENDVFRFSADLLEHKPKIVYRQTSSSLIATLDSNGFHNDKTVHIIIPKNNLDISFVLGLFNSKLMNYYYQQINDEEGRTFAQVKILYIKQLPIPNITLSEQQPITAIVNQILSAKQENPAANPSALEREIDLLVYGLYGLGEEEIEIIENSIKK